MKRAGSWLALAMVCGSLMGCTIKQRPGSLPAHLPPGQGVIVGSLVSTPLRLYDGTLGKQFIFVKFRHKATKETKTLRIEDNITQDFVHNGSPGYLFAFVLPEGAYEIYTVSIAISLNGTLWTVYEPRWGGTYIPFTVANGETAYLGQLLYASAPFGGTFELSNQWQRDASRLSTLYPDVDWSRTSMQLLRADKASYPIFQNAD